MCVLVVQKFNTILSMGLNRVSLPEIADHRQHFKVVDLLLVYYIIFIIIIVATTVQYYSVMRG